MIESADGLAQVAVVVGRAQVDLHVLVVGDDPRKDGILVLQMEEKGFKKLQLNITIKPSFRYYYLVCKY